MGKDLPVHSRELCTQKVCRPPFLKRACSVTVDEEKRRTLLPVAFLDLSTDKSWQKKGRKNKTGMLWLVVWAGSRTLFKNNPGTGGKHAQRQREEVSLVILSSHWGASGWPMSCLKWRRTQTHLPLLPPSTHLHSLRTTCSHVTTPSLYLCNTFAQSFPLFFQLFLPDHSQICLLFSLTLVFVITGKRGSLD